MPNFYFTCGQVHSHNLPYQNKIWNKDNVLKVVAPDHLIAKKYINANFGNKWSNVYDDSTLEISYFKGGIVHTVNLNYEHP